MKNIAIFLFTPFAGSSGLQLPDAPGISRRDTLSTLATSGLVLSSDGISRRGAPPPPRFASSASPPTQSENLLLLPPKPGFVRLYLCRHGETEYNRLGLAQGRRINADLNPKGEAQAAALGKFLAPLPPTGTVYSSSLLRAMHTADVVAAGRGGGGGGEAPSVRRVLGCLDEIDFGDLEGQGGGAAGAIAAVQGRWSQGEAGARVGGSGGESFDDVRARVREALAVFAADVGGADAGGGGGQVVAVAHSAYLHVFLSVACGLPLATVLPLDQRNCCVNVLDLPRDLKTPARARTINGIAHLGGGLVTRKSPALVSFAQDTAALAASTYTTLR